MVDQGLVNQVWFVVSPQNPLKSAGSLLNEYHRLHMVNLGIEGDNRFRVSDVEFKMPRPSYTIDTLIYLKEKYPQHEFKVVIGSDSIQNIRNWKNTDLLLRDYTFLVYERPAHPITHAASNIIPVKAPLLDISSTYIRNNVKQHRSIKYFVPENVASEIDLNNYYR